MNNGTSELNGHVACLCKILKALSLATSVVLWVNESLSKQTAKQNHYN